MKSYYKISLEVSSEQEAEILMTQLEELSFYAFETEEIFLHAYIRENDFDEEWLKCLGNTYTITRIQETNWNQKWEESFTPVVINNFVGVRAAFHPPVRGVKYEIIITPKMSFGTGHHATTVMMMELMREVDFAGKSVIDFGAGTGILSILAEKLGATRIRAIDIDENCIESCGENIQQNHCLNIEVIQGSIPGTGGQADIILANISLQVLKDAERDFANLVAPGGLLLVSGFLVSDVRDLMEGFEGDFEIKDQMQQEAWSAIEWQRIPVKL